MAQINVIIHFNVSKHVVEKTRLPNAEIKVKINCKDATTYNNGKEQYHSSQVDDHLKSFVFLFHSAKINELWISLGNAMEVIVN